MSVGKLDRSIVMVGLMGAGKSSIGRRLANRLGLPFVDADNEIEKLPGAVSPKFSTGSVKPRSAMVSARSSSA